MRMPCSLGSMAFSWGMLTYIIPHYSQALAGYCRFALIICICVLFIQPIDRLTVGCNMCLSSRFIMIPVTLHLAESFTVLAVLPPPPNMP